MRDPGDLVVILDKHKQMTALDKGRLAAELHEILVDEVRISMDAQQAPDGEPWAPLADDYAHWKDQHYPGQPIGELLGKMKDDQNIRGTATVLFDRMYVSYGMDDAVKVYARVFNDGSEHQPARPFLGFSDACQERMAAAINQHIADGLQGRD